MLSEDWISCYKIYKNENDFMKVLYDHGIPFYIVKFKKQKKIY